MGLWSDAIESALKAREKAADRGAGYCRCRHPA